MTAQKFRRWAEEHQITMLSPAPGVPSRVEEIAGPGVKGSWWSHPKGVAIYNTSQALIEDPTFLSVKLVVGKVTFVHKNSLPLLLRVVCDEGWRRRALAQVDAPARYLFDLTERSGGIRLDMLARDWAGGAKALKKSKQLLDKRGLAVGADMHTAAGTHTALLESWHHVRKRMGVEPDMSISLDVAVERLKAMAAGNRLTAEVI